MKRKADCKNIATDMNVVQIDDFLMGEDVSVDLQNFKIPVDPDSDESECRNIKDAFGNGLRINGQKYSIKGGEVADSLEKESLESSGFAGWEADATALCRGKYDVLREDESMKFSSSFVNPHFANVVFSHAADFDKLRDSLLEECKERSCKFHSSILRDRKWRGVDVSENIDLERVEADSTFGWMLQMCVLLRLGEWCAFFALLGNIDTCDVDRLEELMRDKTPVLLEVLQSYCCFSSAEVCYNLASKFFPFADLDGKTEVTSGKGVLKKWFCYYFYSYKNKIDFLKNFANMNKEMKELEDCLTGKSVYPLVACFSTDNPNLIEHSTDNSFN